MSKSYFRKVAFGIGPDEKMPKDAVSWAKDQVDTVPDLTWQGEIPTGKDLLTRYSNGFIRIEKFCGKTQEGPQGLSKSKRPTPPRGW